MYFKSFPKVISRGNTSATGGVHQAVDILRRVGFSDTGKTGSEYFFNYNIKEVDTPDTLADKIYGSSDYYWVILMFNNIIDPFFDWPLNHKRFENCLKEKYKGANLFLGEGISGSFSVGDTVAVISSSGDTGFGGVVEEYDPTFRKLRVSGLNPTESFTSQDYIQSYNEANGNDWEDFVGGGTVERIVTDSLQSIHHFGVSGSQTAGYNDIGGGTATSSVILDPLSKYDGISQLSLGDDGITFYHTLLYDYIFNGSNDYVVTNEQYERDLNESKRTISLLQPKYIPQVVKELKNLIKI